jgi:thiamine biosynthesis lipoprotein
MSEVVRRAQPWLGTLVSIELIADSGNTYRAQPFARGFSAIERVHHAMSAQDPRSDVARFNAAGEGASIRCDPWTIHMLRSAARLRDASEGLFDVALGTAHAAYRIIDAQQVLKLDGAGRIDLGGIAKGFAVDRAVAAMRRCGVRRGLVNAGGDLRVFGGGAWPVIVRGGHVLTLERGALATSQYRQGRSPYHDDALIMPTTHAVHAVDRAITVAAPSCALADALTKVVALTGDAAHPLVHRLGGRAWLQ